MAKASPGHPFRTILNYNLPYWRDYFIGAMLAVFFVLVGLAEPLLIRAVVSGLEKGTISHNMLLLVFAGLLFAAVLTGIARYWERLLIIQASRKCEYDLRNDYFRHVESLSQEFFHRYKTGDIMARATNDLNYVRMFIGPGIMGSIDMMRVPFTIGLMLWLSWRLTLVALLPLPFVSVLVYFVVMYMHRQSLRVQDLFSDVSSRVQENLAGARVVKAYGIMDRELAAFRKESEVYMRENMKLASLMAFIWPLIGLIVGLVLLLIIWRGGRMVISDELDLGDLTGFIVCLMLLVWPLAEFGWILSLYQRGSAGMNRINEVFAAHPAVTERPGASDRRIEQGGIRLDHVSFAYEPHHAVIDDVTLEIPAGATAAIVGPTGSGKTTLLNLLAREYDADAGVVSVDGRDVRDLSLRALRDAIGYVPQDVFLFSESIRDNLMLSSDVSRDDLQRACDIAQFTETLQDLPAGLDTLLGERGVNLSGGQKQRLTIARALLRNPRILMLDDALSSVDTHTEDRILEGLRGFMAERTSIIVSHRVSTVKHADIIFVLENGTICEQGSHDELLSRSGLYAKMHERQLLEDEVVEFRVESDGDRK